jgi:hypothetical protein
MGKADSYEDLIFQLGDLARERLADDPEPPRSMDRVFRAEEVVLARREELENLEREMNEEDAEQQAFLTRQEAERAEQLEIVRKWKRAVEGVEGRTKELRKKLSSKKAVIRYEGSSLKKAEEKHQDLELTQSHDEKGIKISKENLKKLRLGQMRRQREVEEIQDELNHVLTPRPGQPGAQGILAHMRVIEMELEAEARLEVFEKKMSEIDAGIAGKDQEVQAAEDYLDQAIFLLGEEVYAARIEDDAFSELYERLDKVE